MSLFSKKSKDQPPKAPVAPAAPARAAAPPPVSAPRTNGAAPPKAAEPQVNMEDIKAGFERSRRTLVALGEICSVLMKSPEYRGMTLASLQALVAPAISTSQYLVLTAHQKSRGAAAPVAVAMWANVTPEVDRRLTQGDGQNVALAPADWNAGTIAWLILVAGDQRTLPALVSQLQKTKLKGRPIKIRTKGEDGNMQVRTITASDFEQKGAPQTTKH